MFGCWISVCLSLGILDIALIEVSGYWILDIGYWILDIGYWILAPSGYWLLPHSKQSNIPRLGLIPSHCQAFQHGTVQKTKELTRARQTLHLNAARTTLACLSRIAGCLSRNNLDEDAERTEQEPQLAVAAAARPRTNLKPQSSKRK